MKLAFDHVNEMMETHRIKCFGQMVLPGSMAFERGDLRAPQDHRRIYIAWEPGSSHRRVGILDTLDEYKEQGYRVYTIDQNFLTSSIRLAKGDLKAVEVLDLMLESRSLVSFDQTPDGIHMEFASGVSQDHKFMQDKRAVLKEIKDFTYDITCPYLNFLLSVSEKKVCTDMVLNNSLSQVIKTMDCPDCKDGYYYPFNGPKEPCQTCKHNHQEAALEVANSFSEYLFLEMGATRIKSTKSPENNWKTFCVNLNISKDNDNFRRVAQEAAQSMERFLKDQYSKPIAFMDLYSEPLPTKDHLRSNFSGVSALVSMHEIGNELQFQFQIKVSP